MIGWVYLGVAIIAEVIGTSFLKESDGFSKLGPSIVTVIGYGVAIVGLSFAVKTIDVGIAYAVWAGLGTALIVTVGWVVFGQQLDLGAWFGVAMIVGGVIVINVFSGTASA